MDDHGPVTHYAVLVGIDDYPEDPLKSAACDALEARKLLDSRLKDCVKIHTLVAERRDQNPISSVQDPILRPTRKGFVDALNGVINVATPDSFVYIHFSGHGTSKSSETEKGSSDMGLVLLSDDDSNEVSYLWGEDFADLVRLMIDKNLVVTVVLDCCFSGAVHRRGSEVRYLPYNAKMDPEMKQIRRNFLEAQSYSLDRDILFLPNWLRDSKGYAIITACGPHEFANSLKFNDQLNGILSYYLFETLRYIGLTRSLKTVHDRLCAKIRGCEPDQNRDQHINQNPILYGNKNQAFFGSLEFNSVGINISVIKRKDGTIELQAGRAHGISTDDKFAMFPAEGETIPNQSSLIARAIQCNSLTSILEVCDPSTKSARTGWLARVVSQSRLQTVPIRLASSIPDQPSWLLSMETRSLKAHNDMSDSPAAFELALDSDRQYQLRDGNGSKLANLPAMPRHQIIPDEVCDILEHLVRFRLVGALTSEASDHLDKVEISVRYNKKSYGPTDYIAMKLSTTAEVVVANRGDRDVFVFAYYLDPNWQIQQLFAGSYYLVQPGCTGRKRFRMTMSRSANDQSHETYVDILKIIVTSKPTSFDMLELPRLREPARRRSGDATRKVAEGPENWTATNFFIHISKDEDSFMTPNVNQ